MIRLSALVATLLTVTGCATGPVFQKPEPVSSDSAQLYVYRVARMLGAATPHRVLIDGAQEPLSLPNGSWQRVVLPPGHHSVVVKDVFGVMYCGPSPLAVHLQPGETAYVETEVLLLRSVGIYTDLRCTLKQQHEEAALKELQNLRAAQ